MRVKHTILRPWFIRVWMKLNDFDALTTPWKTIYYKDAKSFMDEKLHKHELTHIEQMERDGAIWFLLKYNYYWLRYGYKKNPYEVEARLAEKE